MVNQKMIRALGLLFPLLLLLGCEQARVDAQMEELCKQDGGMKIYEKVVLPEDQFTEYGDVKFFVKWDKSGSSGGGYRFLTEEKQIRTKKPTLSKTTNTIIREEDNKILGTYVYYLRIGGGVLPRLGPDPAKRCPLIKGGTTFFSRSIFVKEKN